MTAVALPGSLTAAVARGFICRCPRCGKGRLFPRILKPAKACESCGQDWTLHQADDFPAYLTIFISGHIMIPVLAGLIAAESIPVWMDMFLALGLGITALVTLLQPCKGAVIAVQWWMGMHGFRLAGRDEARGRGPHS